MNEQYSQAYDAIYRREVSESTWEGVSGVYGQLEALIDRLEEEFRSANYTLRPDAKVALITNAMNLAVLPFALVEDDPRGHLDELEDDIRTVAYGAREIVTPATARGEISSHAVFESAVEHWSGLRMDIIDNWA